MQFYYGDEQLLRLLTRYAGTALVAGDVALLVVTRPHQQRLERRLAARGLDLSIASNEGRHVVHDAQETLDQIVVDGEVNELCARAVLGQMLSQACGTLSADGGPARVYVFAEISTLLAAQSGPAEALALEEIWNALGHKYAFALCCGYAMHAFSSRHAASFVRICSLHSQVFHASDIRRAEVADTIT